MSRKQPLLLVLLLVVSFPFFGRGQAPCGTEVDSLSLAMMNATRAAAQTHAKQFVPGEKNVVSVPVQVHIFRTSAGSGGLSLADYYTAMAIVNDLYAGANMSFFDCAPPQFIDSDTYYDYDNSSERVSLQAAYQVPDVINIYVFNSVLNNNNNSVCGIAYYPGASIDMIAIDKDCFTNGSTLSHELGHYFGLYHTHGKNSCGPITDELVDGSNCTDAGDDVCDTPADPNLRGENCDFDYVDDNCNYTGTLTDANGDFYNPYVSNIMSYAMSYCRDFLTTGQLIRANFFLTTARDYLVCGGATIPDNDLCANAIPIFCGESAFGSTDNATTDDAPQNCGTSLDDSGGLWYRFTGTGEEVTASLCNSDYDTKIGVFFGPCSDLFCVTGTDDGGDCDVQSEVTFSSIAGMEYFIYVTGFGSNTGNFTLELTCTSTCSPPDDTEVVSTGFSHFYLSWGEGQTTNVRFRELGSPDWNVFTDFGGIISVNKPPCTTYEVQVQSVCNDVPGPWSASEIVATLGCGDPYCYAYGNTFDHWITNVSFAGIDNSTGNDWGHGNFTNLTAQVDRETGYDISLTPGTDVASTTVYWRVWIDLNGDEDFTDSGEQVLSTTGSSTQSLTVPIFIPPGSYAGPSRMRVAMSADGFREPCQINGFADVEDYGIEINAAFNCLPPDDIEVVSTGFSHFYLDWSDVTGQTTNVRYREVGEPNWIFLEDFNAIVSTIKLPCTDYEVQVQSVCDDVPGPWSNSVLVSTLGCNDPYCYAYGIPFGHWISNVSFAGIDNATGNDWGHADFTNLTAQVNREAAYDISLTPATDVASTTVYWRVWIDLNGDGDFTDSGEQVLSMTSSSTQSLTVPIFIPSGSYAGPSRMRVAMSADGFREPCQINGDADVEDYGIEINAAAITCACPETYGWNPLICEGFEGYSVGGNVADVAPDFSNFPGAPANLATITNDFASEGQQAARLTQTAADTYGDVLLDFGKKFSGIYRLEWDMRLASSSSTASFGILNDYLGQATADNNWAYLVRFSDNGSGTVSYGQGSATDHAFSYPAGQWFHVIQVINLDADQVDLWIAGSFVGRWPLSAGEDTPGSLSLDDLNIWGGASGSSSTTGQVYLDNFCVNSMLQTTCTTNYQPVCVAGQEYTNSCVAGLAGYTESEWTEGECENCPAPSFTYCESQFYYLESNGDHIFTTGGDTSFAVGQSWYLNGAPIEASGITVTGNGSPVIFCDFGNAAGSYEICYPYLDESGCVQYCCELYCIDPDPSEEIGYDYQPDGNFFSLTLEVPAAGSASWYYFSNGLRQSLGNGNTVTVPVPGNCVTRTFYCRYYDFSGECWRVVRRTIYLCNPYDCGDLTSQYNPSTGAYDLTLTGAASAEQITWQDDDTDQTLPGNGTSISLPWDGQCRTRNISVRYYSPVTGQWTLCCLSFDFCPPVTCPDPQVEPFCTEQTYQRDSDGTYRFVATADFATGRSWLVNGTPIEQTNLSYSGNGTPSLEIDFASGQAGTYEICQPVPADDNCVDYCCRTYCIDPPTQAHSIEYTYSPAEEAIVLSIAGPVPVEVSWYQLNSNGTAVTIGTGGSVTVPIPDNCSVQTYYCRYGDIWSECYQLLERTIYLCDPFACGNIDFTYEADQVGYRLTLTGSAGAESISWIDDDTGQQLSGTGASIFLPLDAQGCRTRSISVRYFADGAWRLCCLRFYFCDPAVCADDIAFSLDGNLAILSLPFSDPQAQWTADGQSIGTGPVVSLPVPEGNTVRVCVRYFDGQLYRLCCREIDNSGCPLPIAQFALAQADNVVNVTHTAGPIDSYLWTFGTVTTSSAPQPAPVMLPPGTHTICLTVTNDCGSDTYCQDVIIPDPASDLTFDIDDEVCGAPGEVVSIPVRVRNFSNILNFQMTLEIENTNVGTIQDVVFLPGFGNAFTAVQDAGQRATLTWFSNNGRNMTDEAIIAYIEVLLSPNADDYSDLNFNGGITPVFAEDGDFNELTPILLPGSVGRCASIDLAGVIRREDNATIGLVEVALYRDGQWIETQVTGPDGAYAFPGLAAGSDYRIVPTKDINYRNHVNAGDLSRIAQHITFVTQLAGPYKRIAADVRDDGNINSGDLSTVNRLILHDIDEFSAVDSWRFVAADFVFPNPGNPTANSFPEAIVLTNQQLSRSDLDFLGAKMGDVSNGANTNELAPPGLPRQTGDMILSLRAEEAIQNETLVVDVTAQHFADMLAGQFSIAWDSTGLDFQLVENFAPALSLTTQNFSFEATAAGQLPWVWYSVTPVSLADTAVLFSLVFEVTGAAGDSVYIEFSETPTPYYFEDTAMDFVPQFNDWSSTIEMTNPVRSAPGTETWTIYPNPTDGRLFLTSTRPGDHPDQATLYNLNGQAVLRWTELDRPLNVSRLPAGTYYLRLQSDRAQQVEKVIVTE